MRDAPDRQSLIDAIPTQVWIASPDGAMTYVNRQRLEYTGLALEDALGWGWTKGDVFHPADLPALIDTWREALAAATPIEAEARVRRYDGVYRWFLIRAVPCRNDAGEIVEWLGTNTDIDDRKGAEDDLRRTESYLAAAQALSRTGSFHWKVSTGALTWSPVTYSIFQFDQSVSPTLDHVYSRVHPDDLASVKAVVARAASGFSDLDFEHRLLLPDSSVRYLRCRARAVRDGDAVEFVGAISDVTDARLAAEQLQRSEREYRQIVDAIPLLITALSRRGAVLYVNRSVFEYSGLDVEAIEEGSRLFHPDDFPRLKKERRRGLRGAVPFETEARARRHDGVFRWFRIDNRPVFDEQGRIARWYVTGIDIDDQKRTEERMRNENAILREEVDRASMFEEIVGTSAALKGVLRHVAKVAPTDSTVLVSGETGTGKELVARAIHRRSRRAGRAFVAVNCAAIPASLIASELFGHERGAFTGALQRRHGKFELADGGTIFLDEVGELPPDTQVALLRVLQEREIERVGGDRPIRIDVRVIAATNRDLQAAIADRTFRSDLFYRLNVFPIDMPALRDRAGDIPLLVEYFAHRLARRHGKTLAAVDPRTLSLLQAYPWPGNIRELQNVIERAVIVAEGGVLVVDERWLVSSAAPVVASASLDAELVAHERARVEAALTASKGRVSGPTGAAVRLGIPRSTLESRIRSLRVDKHRFRSA